MKCCVLALLVATSLVLAQQYSEDQLRDVNNRFGSNSFETITPTGSNVLLQNQVLNPGFNNDQQSQWLSIYDNEVTNIPPQTCGNGITEGYELCDVLISDWNTFPLCTALGYSPAPGNANLHIGCNQQCSFDRQGLQNFQCDGSQVGPVTTSTGNNCGNGQIDPFEQCDFANGAAVVGGATCESVGLGFTSGQLGCRFYIGTGVSNILTCQYDFSQCRRATPGCGDGVVNGVEQCDPPGSTADCSTIGLDASEPGSSVLYCSPTCDWDLGMCLPYGQQTMEGGEASLGGPQHIDILCGNNIIDKGEQCDGTILASATCESLGYQTGSLVCTGCRFDIRGCGNQGGLVTVVAVGPDVEDVEVGDVVAIAANATCNAFGLNNFLTDRNQYCIVDESDIAVTLQEGNLFFDKTDVQTQAGFSAAVPVSGSDIDNF